LPDESCRRCGGMLLELMICAKCKATTQFICRICAHTTIPRIHDSICFKIDDISSPKQMNESNYKIKLYH
jgi:hypothetical protein